MGNTGDISNDAGVLDAKPGTESQPLRTDACARLVAARTDTRALLDLVQSPQPVACVKWPGFRGTDTQSAEAQVIGMASLRHVVFLVSIPGGFYS